MNPAFRMQVRFWGVRGSIPTPAHQNLGFGGNTTCLEVRSASQDLLVVDAGTGAHSLGLSLLEEFSGHRLDVHFLMTHFHWDHIQGLPFFAPMYAGANRITFHSGSPPGVARQALVGQMVKPYYPIGFDVLAAGREFAQITAQPSQHGNIAIHAFPLNHPQGAWGYRLESGGSSIVHASDLEHGDPKFDSVLREHAQNADLLIYDAQYSPQEHASKEGWGHSTWLEATRVAHDARVKHLILFHHDPGHDDSTIRDLVRQARHHFENTDAAREGWSVCV